MSIQSSTASRRKRTSRKKHSIWPWLLILLCFLIAVAAGAFFASRSLADKPKPKAEDGLLTAKDKTTVMIMGVDERAGDVGRSDTLMIATVDPKKNQATLLSIPRDTRVKIKGHDYDKINAAYAYGGERLTQNTVENFLGVSMDHYIIINTHAFQRIVDALGGIDIHVEKRMYYEDPWDDDGGLLIDLRPGLQHMDGKTAVTYVRYRDEEGDIGRIKRQQKFMQACVEKLTSPTILPKLPALISEIMDSIRTDMSTRQLLELAGTLSKAHKNGLQAEMVPGNPVYIDEISYWIADLSAMRTTLARTLGIAVSERVKKDIERAEKEYKSSIPAHAIVPVKEKTVEKSVPSKQDAEDAQLEEDIPKKERRLKKRTPTEKSTDTPNAKSATDTSRELPKPTSGRVVHPSEEESVPSPTSPRGKEQ